MGKGVAPNWNKKGHRRGVGNCLGRRCCTLVDSFCHLLYPRASVCWKQDLFKRGDVAICVWFLILFLLRFFGFKRASYYVAQVGLRIIAFKVLWFQACATTLTVVFFFFFKCLDFFVCLLACF